jgi:hypothetical protein
MINGQMLGTRNFRAFPNRRGAVCFSLQIFNKRECMAWFIAHMPVGLSCPFGHSHASIKSYSCAERYAEISSLN